MESLILPKSFNIPESILPEILLKLPVKSLLRFKCVNKVWCNLISSSYFVSMHLNNYASMFALVKSIDSSKRVCSFTLLSPAADTILPSMNIELPSSFPEFRSSVLGSRNGIVCLLNYEDEVILLWNPATRDLKLLPQNNTIYVESFHVLDVGFGFDSKTNDYKILQKVLLKSSKIKKFGLYSLRSDSWKTLVLPNHVKERMDQCKGWKEWINLSFKDKNILCSYRLISDKWEIVSFDFSNEKFDFIPFPSNHNDGTLFPLKESIALITGLPRYFKQKVGSFNVWVMSKGISSTSTSNRFSWTKLLTIRSSDIGQTKLCYYYPLTHLGNGQLIFTDECRSFIIYDILTGQKIKHQLDPYTSVFEFKESLVAISNSHCDVFV